MALKYPKVLSEDETLDLALAGHSLARYGDGELRVALGGNCISQIGNKKLASELAKILKEPKGSPVIPCIPNVVKTVKPAWRNYASSTYTNLYSDRSYGSAFITRPDSAPWIDRPDYWAKVKSLWEGKDVTLVLGTERSLRPAGMEGVKSLREVWGPRCDAYAEIDRIEAEIGEPTGPVLICLGPTATVLAWRLARKGVWAIDLGHIGMFMRHAGAYNLKMDDLISSYYIDQNRQLHKRPEGFGGSGKKQAERVFKFIKEIKASSVLDYGCGQGTLAVALRDLGYSKSIFEYDPAVKGKNILPKPAELLVCTDVLEHVEPTKLDTVLRHMFKLTVTGAYLLVATRPAGKILPDGRNAHLIQQKPDWWKEQIKSVGFKIIREEIVPNHDLKLWCMKK